MQNNQIEDAIKKGATIVDVRTVGEFNMGHVQGSLNIPLQEVPYRVDEFTVMQKPIVLCCASGGRSAQATQFLLQNGVNEVYNAGSWFTVDEIVNS